MANGSCFERYILALLSLFDFSFSAASRCVQGSFVLSCISLSAFSGAVVSNHKHLQTTQSILHSNSLPALWIVSTISTFTVKTN